MARQRGGVVGRRDELAELVPPDGRGGLVVLRGALGSGRSAVLAALGRELRADGVVVLDVGFGGERVEWDLFGACAVLAAVRERFEDLDADPALGASISAVAGLCTPESYGSPARRSALLAEMGRMFTRIGVRSRVALLADDVDAVGQPLFALAPAHLSGHYVVAGCSGDAGRPGGSAELCDVADRVVELGPLPDADVDLLLRRVGNVPVDPAVPAALRAALGPLYGNPATLLATVAELRARDRLVVAHDHLCLRDLDPGCCAAPIALPAGHPLLTEVGDGPARDLVVLAAGDTDLGVDDVPALAAATGRPVDECGREVDRLVRAGVLDGDAAGRLSLRCPALGTTLLEQAGCGTVAELHRAMAAHLHAAAQAGAPCDPSVLADHVVAAGAALPPTPDLATLLHDEAVRVAVLHPDHAARRYLAAWRHAGPGRGRMRVQSELVRLLVRNGRCELLTGFVAEIVAEGPPEADPRVRSELAVAAALAALHCGRPVSAAVRDALAEPGDEHCPLRFCDRWFAGEPLELDDLVAAFAHLTDGWPRPQLAATLQDRSQRRRRARFGVEVAFATRALVPVFEWLYGVDYGAPAHGALAAYHRVVQTYATGAWTEALCAAREVATATHGDPLSRQIAQLLAAEMCNWRGEDRRATAWLDAVPADGPFTAIRGWVACGIRYREGDAAAALAAGWDAYSRIGSGSGDAGGWRLLVRMATVAAEAGDTAWTARLAEETSARERRNRATVARESISLLVGLTTGDETAVREGLALVRGREHRPELAWACLATGLVAADPQRWLHEAYEIAREIGAPRLRARAKQLMAGRGVAAPVARARPDRFSDVEVRIVELIRDGATNRQIAIAIGVSEKTVENHLTKLFLKAGCRTRHGLAAASLDGRLEAIGA
ncbi:MAG: LuxR family transcriptional regulator [Pseudonocardia sediminis]